MPSTTRARTSGRSQTRSGRSQKSSNNSRRTRRSAPSSTARSARSNGKVNGASKTGSAARRSSGGSRSRRSSNGAVQTATKGAGGVAHSVGEAGKTVTKFVALPAASAAVSAAAGIVGGIVLGRYGIKRPRKKVLGIPMPGSRNGLDNLAKQVGEAGKQFGKLATEVRTTREKAGEIGKALS